jgi:lipoprotein-anchoring transpeptidase ErfK/SrfK
VGSFEIVTKQLNPWWYPPDSDWAEGAEPIPPGPGNPLGTRWMGLSAPAVGIHGTPDAASIGYSASHGCIRMHVPEAEWLFQRVKEGTPVYIVDA